MRLALTLVALAGCTTLGPTPLTTGMSAQPVGRSSVAAQLGFVGGYYLSESTQEEPVGAPLAQAAVLVEPGASAPGLVVGGRVFGGNDGDSQTEPMLGYRARTGTGTAALGVFASGTIASGASDGASYDVRRLSGEVVLDGELVRATPWLALSAAGRVGVSASAVSASYCAGANGFGVDCDGRAANATADLDLVTPSIGGGLALDAGTGKGAFHRARLEAHLLAASVPQVQQGLNVSRAGVVTIGMTLTVAFGAK